MEQEAEIKKQYSESFVLTQQEIIKGLEADLAKAREAVRGLADVLDLIRRRSPMDLLTHPPKDYASYTAGKSLTQFKGEIDKANG